jgi:hypothetical protein
VRITSSDDNSVLNFCPIERMQLLVATVCFARKRIINFQYLWRLCSWTLAYC